MNNLNFCFLRFRGFILYENFLLVEKIVVSGCRVVIFIPEQRKIERDEFSNVSFERFVRNVHFWNFVFFPKLDSNFYVN